MATESAPPALDITTLVPREKVRIDGKLYDMRASGEFPYLSYRHWAAKFDRLAKFFASDKTLSRPKTQERDRLLDECCRMVLLAPPEVHKKLSSVHRMQIVTVFFELLAAAWKGTSTPTAGATVAASKTRPTKSQNRTRTKRTGKTS